MSQTGQFKIMKRLGQLCAKSPEKWAEHTLDAVITASETPPKTLLHKARSFVGGTITKTGEIIDPAKKESA